MKSERKKSTAPPAVHIALLRGVNVGGKNKLPMRELPDLFQSAGATAAQTYIQSGNVVFAANAAVARSMAEAVPKLIEDKFGFRPPIVLRSAAELEKVAAGNPYLRADADESALYVGFLADAPAAAHKSKLNPERSPGDRYELIGRDIYMHLLSGAADTKLTTAYFDSTLATTSTFRNWRTVLKLVELARSFDGAAG